MSLFPERIDGDIDREPLDESHHVVYLVKRPAYTLILAVPKTLPLPARRGTGLLSDTRDR